MWRDASVTETPTSSDWSRLWRESTKRATAQRATDMRVNVEKKAKIYRLRSNTWALKLQAVVFLNDSRHANRSRPLTGPGAEREKLYLHSLRGPECLFRQLSTTWDPEHCIHIASSCASPSRFQPQARKQTASTDCPSTELSANQRAGQSESGPISERERAGQIWSGLGGG